MSRFRPYTHCSSSGIWKRSFAIGMLAFRKSAQGSSLGFVFQIVCLEVSRLISVLLCPSLVLCYCRNPANLRSRATDLNLGSGSRFFINLIREHDLFFLDSISLDPVEVKGLRVIIKPCTLQCIRLIFFCLIDISLCFLERYKFPWLLVFSRDFGSGRNSYGTEPVDRHTAGKGIFIRLIIS